MFSISAAPGVQWDRSVRQLAPGGAAAARARIPVSRASLTATKGDLLGGRVAQPRPASGCHAKSVSTQTRYSACTGGMLRRFAWRMRAIRHGVGYPYSGQASALRGGCPELCAAPMAGPDCIICAPLDSTVCAP